LRASDGIDPAIGNRYDTSGKPGLVQSGTSRAGVPLLLPCYLELALEGLRCSTREDISMEYSFDLNAFIPFLHS
jgi:hypothetical protein